MIISINNVSIIRNNEYILKNLSLDFKPGKVNIILGKSGSGKSCLVKACVSLMKIDSGTITINNANIQNQNLSEGRLSNIGFVFQSNALFDSLSVKENIIFGMGQDTSDELIKNTLERVGLENNILNKYPNEISGGMKKRVAIARSIIRKNTKILILDEPTTGLDPVTSNTIAQTIKNIAQESNLTIICITHDIKFAQTTGDYFFLLKNKKIAWQNTSLNDNNNIITKYLNGVNYTH